jgi:predicted P-loop ATPase/GTPase
MITYIFKIFSSIAILFSNQKLPPIVEVNLLKQILAKNKVKKRTRVNKITNLVYKPNVKTISWGKETTNGLIFTYFQVIKISGNLLTPKFYNLNNSSNSKHIYCHLSQLLVSTLSEFFISKVSMMNWLNSDFSKNFFFKI